MCLIALGTELVGPGQVALRFPVSLLTHFVLRQRLGDVSSRQDLPGHICTMASREPGSCHLSHTPLSLCLLGALLHITAWSCGSVARWLTSAWCRARLGWQGRLEDTKILCSWSHRCS